MKRLSIALAAAFALSGPALAQQGSMPTQPGAQMQPGSQMQPGAAQEGIQGPVVWVNTDVFTGTVAGIDRAQRRLMARSDDGDVLTMAVGPDVRNFENLRMGDRVTVRYTEAEAVALAKQTDQRQDWGEIRTRVESTATAQAPAGAARPGLGAVERTTVVANVFDIDKERGILTLRGTSGVPVDIRTSPQALEQIDLNDQIAISYMEATAVEITPERMARSATTEAGRRSDSRDANR